VATRFLDDPARAAFKRAIEAVEDASAVEVVVAVRRSSAPYLHANAIVGALVAFAALATALYSSHEFGLTSILIDPFVVGAVAAASTQLLPGAKRLLTPARTRADAVARAARATFVDRNIHTTTGRSGVLVYISWLERRVALVADVGLLRALPDGALARAEADLTAAVPRGGAEVARRLEALAPRMASAMPHQADDVNELPDAIDEAP
jgi:putative membrane protein